MSRIRYWLCLITLYAGAIGICIGLAAVVWSFTGAPMLRNYQECHRITLCVPSTEPGRGGDG